MAKQNEVEDERISLAKVLFSFSILNRILYIIYYVENDIHKRIGKLYLMKELVYVKIAAKIFLRHNMNKS